MAYTYMNTNAAMHSMRRSRSRYVDSCPEYCAAEDCAPLQECSAFSPQKLFAVSIQEDRGPGISFSQRLDMLHLLNRLLVNGYQKACNGGGAPCWRTTLENICTSSLLSAKAASLYGSCTGKTRI